MSRPVRRSDLFRSRLRSFTRMLPGVAAGDPRAVHRARVASRRLRELLPLLQLEGHVAQKLGKRPAQGHAPARRRPRARRPPDAARRRISNAGAAGAEPAPRRHWAPAASRREPALPPSPSASDLRRIGAEARRRRPSKLEAADEQRVPSRATDRQWRWAVDARVAHRAGALKKAIDEAGCRVPPRAVARGAHRAQEAALRARGGGRSRWPAESPGPAEAEAGAARARPDARPAGAGGSRAPGAGVVPSGRGQRRGHAGAPLDLARARRADPIARGRVPPAPRALHARARGPARALRSAADGSLRTRSARAGRRPVSARRAG